MPEKLRVAIVGAGYFGQFHYDAWSRMPEVEIAAIVVRNPDAAIETAAKWGRAGAPLPVFTDAAAMMETIRPDIVDITAPPEAHLDTIRALAPYAPWIVCQKPFCGTLDAAREAVTLCARHGARIAVHENIRFQPWYRAAKALIDGGAIGAPWQITFRLRPGDGQGPRAYLDRQPYFQTMPRLLVHETAVHWIDTFRCLMGETSCVYASLAKLNPVIAGEDAGLILFDFESGARGLFDGNRLSDHIAGNRRRTMGEMWIEGPGGTLRLDGEGHLWLREFGQNVETRQPFAWNDHLFGGDCVYLCNRHILDAWRADDEPETAGGAYLRNQEVEEAIYRSAETGTRLAV